MQSTPSTLISRRLADCLVTFCIYFLYAGAMVPGVNETHYWIKAKHFWNSEFVSRDLFAASGDAHWFFFQSIGWITLWLPLSWTAWITRILGWGVLSGSWCYLANSISNRTWSGSLSSLLFLTCIHYGHLSGEWVIGGMEAKIFAYAALWMGLACMCTDRWPMAWVWMGVASAFHVLVGGWATLTLMILYTSKTGCYLPWGRSWRLQWPWLIAGGSLSLLGLVPAILVNRGASIDLQSQGAWLHVYYRLAHHLAPLSFSRERWMSFGILFALAIALFLVWRASARHEAKALSKPPLEIESLNRLWWITWAALAIAAIGLLIDVAVAPWDEYLAANLLRYYWFRWNDVAIPMVVALTVTHLSSSNAFGQNTTGDRFSWSSMTALLILIVPGGVMLAGRFRETWDARLPQAESMSLVFAWESKERQSAVYEDWQQVCHWARESTSTNSLWLTPRHQQTFKWIAERAEFVNWKDVPQDARSLIEWQKRLDIAYPKDESGIARHLELADYLKMSREYGVKYILIDRRVTPQTPLFPCVYPVGGDGNATYAVFEIPDSRYE